MVRIYVGMSGGVDSSLTAALLVEQGYDVTGVYMKNWSQDLPGMKCPWAEDLADAKRVAVQLGIDFKVYDFEQEYKQKVVDYMIDEYKLGRTPNPDIMCNQEVKFKLFLDAALEDGADMIATGHYARAYHLTGAPGTIPSGQILTSPDNPKSDSLLPAGLASLRQSSDGQESNPELSGSLAVATSEIVPNAPGERESNGFSPGKLTVAPVSPSESGMLMKAKDENKDQTYFLYRITGEALGRTLFPLGGFTKPEVREMAKARGLYTAGKKDSQGICFVGQIGVREFLSQYVDVKPGEVIDKRTNKVLGSHDGAIFYTLGQRHGMNIGGGLPYYVVGKDMTKNEVYVTTDLNSKALWRSELELTSVHWINQAPVEDEYDIRVRHRAKLIRAKLEFESEGVILKLVDPERAVTPGQSVVIYSDDVCLGGGIVV
ncbi:MAG: tRNA 2-thiouridine(34) synthase MnmA [Candidatus Saccharimonas sp.]